MARKIIQDIFVSKKREVKNVIKDSDDVAIQKIKKEHTKKHIFPDKKINFKNTNDADGTISKNSHIFLWIISIASVATLLFLVSSIFSSASLIITPRNEKISMNDTYNITTKKDVDVLHFELMTLKSEMSKILPTDGEENVERKAIGKAILYNNFSTVSQRLINNTRLESVDGRIYRLRESIQIPGTKVVGGVKTPGSIEVEIIADIPGKEYNMKMSDFKGDFKIPGFRGSPKYNSFYGRLSADIAGGLIGKVQKVSNDKLLAGREELKNTLRAELLKNLYKGIPDKFILFKDNYYVTYTDLPDTADTEGYKINEKAEINSILFNKDETAQFIAKNKIKAFDGSKVDIAYGEDIIVTILGSTEKPWTEDSLKLKLVGNINIIWSYDSSAILDEIKGQNKSIILSILNKNKNSIMEINSNIKPSWKKVFPENIKKIKIIDSIRDIISK